MAAVAKPSPSDTRTPCPACGGLIHPVAGRCKHCKHDLSAERSVRPAAAAALPALARAATPVPAPAPAPPPLPYQAATIVSPSPVPLPPTLPPLAIDRASEESKPILPPRPTGGHKAVTAPGWLGRNWPIVVIVLASLAIIGAVVLMMLPPSDPPSTKNRGGAGPAPDRMDTDPMVPHSNITPPSPGSDPWANPPSPSAPVPGLPVPVDPFAQGGGTPAPIDPNDPLAPLAPDPFSPPGGGGGLDLLPALMGKMCERVKSCGDPAFDQACEVIAQLPRTPLPANCPAAQRCLDSLDRVDLCGGNADLRSMVLSMSECQQAMSC
jgi:hypothetical protein